MLQLLITFLAISHVVCGYNQISPSVEELIDNNSNVVQTFLVHFKPVYRKINKGKKHRIKENQKDILIRHQQHVRTAQSLFESDHLLLLEEYNMKSFWISNTMRITCPAHFIKDIHKRNDIRYIQLDSEVHLPNIINKQEVSLTKPNEISAGLKYLRISKLRNSQYFDLTGKNAKIGLIDTAYDLDHFNNDQITSKSFTSDPSDSSLNNEHATISLSILIGSNQPTIKTAIAPDAHIYHAKVFHNNNTTKISTILSAMQWLLDPDGDPNTNDYPKVISNSWASLTLKKELMLPFWEALSTMKKLGVIPVFPAGNTGEDQKIALSAGLPHAISIGSVSKNGTQSAFSTRAQVEWEGITYNKPELFAPGENIISLLPNQKFGEISSTSCSSNYVAAIISLIQEANPDLTPKHIKEILLQTTHRLSDGQKTHIVDAYQAIDLSINGGVVKGLIDGPEFSTKILVQPGDLLFESKSTGSFNFFLKEGNYKLSFISNGFRTFTQEITVKKHKTNSLMIDLQSSQEHELSINIVDSYNTKINGVLKLNHNNSKDFIIDNGKLSVKLFEGLYRGRIEVSGLKDQPFLLNVDRNQNQIDYRVSSTPAVLIVKDSKENHQMNRIEQTLQSLNIEFHSTNHTISFDEILAYDIVFWMTGEESFDTISNLEQQTLQKYIQTGGRVILSGENLAYHLQSSDFLQNICQVELASDSSVSPLIQIQQQKTIIGQDKKWYYPDTLKSNHSNSKDIVHYNSGEVAGIYFKSHQGATIVLGFSINQIQDLQARNELVQLLFNSVQPKIQDQIHRIQTLFTHNKKAYHQVVQRFNQQTIQNKQEIKEHLRNFENKKGLHPILEFIFYHDEDPALHENLY